MYGKVKWYRCKLGYGFITADGKDYFFGWSDIQGKKYPTCSAGENVRFSPIQTEGKLRATNIETI